MLAALVSLIAMVGGALVITACLDALLQLEDCKNEERF